LEWGGFDPFFRSIFFWPNAIRSQSEKRQAYTHSRKSLNCLSNLILCRQAYLSRGHLRHRLAYKLHQNAFGGRDLLGEITAPPDQFRDLRLRKGRGERVRKGRKDRRWGKQIEAHGRARE